MGKRLLYKKKKQPPIHSDWNYLNIIYNINIYIFLWCFQDEYVTRHKLDGTIIYADHRIGTVTGYLPHEVVGVSAHKYMEPSDVVIALFAQKQSMIISVALYFYYEHLTDKTIIHNLLVTYFQCG